jgi:hypothetical protein
MNASQYLAYPDTMVFLSLTMIYTKGEFIGVLHARQPSINGYLNLSLCQCAIGKFKCPRASPVHSSKRERLQHIVSKPLRTSDNLRPIPQPFQAYDCRKRDSGIPDPRACPSQYLSVSVLGKHTSYFQYTLRVNASEGWGNAPRRAWRKGVESGS